MGERTDKTRRNISFIDLRLLFLHAGDRDKNGEEFQGKSPLLRFPLGASPKGAPRLLCEL
jgi:hypothetical protein